MIGFVFYFTYPVKIQHITGPADQIEKIYVTFLAHGETERYLVEMNQQDKISGFINTLAATSYTREIYTYTGTTHRLFMIDIVNRDASNTSLTIVEDGKIITLEKKLFQTADNFEMIFGKLLEWTRKNGTVLPITQHKK